MGKNDDDMSDDDIFELIELVHAKKHLWQMKDEEFKDTKLKLASFRQIADQLGYQVEIVTRRWELLKIGYRREKQRRAKYAYSGAPGPHPVPENHAAPKDIAAPEDHEVPGDSEASEDQGACEDIQTKDGEAPKRKISIFFDSLKFLDRMRDSKETYTNLVPREESTQTSKTQSSNSSQNSPTQPDGDSFMKDEKDTNSKDDDDSSEEPSHDLSETAKNDSSSETKSDSSSKTKNDLSESSKDNPSQITKNDSPQNSNNDLSTTVKKELPENTEDDLVDLTQEDSSSSDVSIKGNSPVKMDHTETHKIPSKKRVSVKKAVFVKKESPVKKNVLMRNPKKSGVNRSRVSPLGSPLKPVKVENIKKEDPLISPLLKNISNQSQDTYPSTCYTPGSSKQRRSDPLEQCFMDVSTQLTNFVVNQGATETTSDSDEMFGQTIAKELQKLPEDEKNKKKFLIMKALYET